MKRLALSVVLLVLLLLNAAPAAAEPGGPRVGNLKVSIWPEYDEPRVLVMYEGVLGPGASLPQKVRFRVPRGAEITETCALKKPSDEHLCQLFETSPEGDWLVVTYEVPLPDFFLQFYYNPVSGAGQRALDFGFLPTYPVDNLQLEVQQPLRSSDFAVSPAAQSAASDRQGFKYYRYDFKDVPVDQPVAVKVSYTKADAQPSVAKPPQQGSAAAGGFDSSRLIWVIVAVAMLGAIALVMIRQYLRSRQEPAPTMAWQAAGPARGPSARQPVAGSRAGAPARGAGRGAFCTQCGHGLRPGDRFCSECGAEVGGARWRKS